MIAARLSGDAPPAPSELHELLEGQPLEVLVMAIVLAGEPRLVAERLHAYLERARGVHLEITGDDLRAGRACRSPRRSARR